MFYDLFPDEIGFHWNRLNAGILSLNRDVCLQKGELGFIKEG